MRWEVVEELREGGEPTQRSRLSLAGLLESCVPLTASGQPVREEVGVSGEMRGRNSPVVEVDDPGGGFGYCCVHSCGLAADSRGCASEVEAKSRFRFSRPSFSLAILEQPRWDVGIAAQGVLFSPVCSHPSVPSRLPRLLRALAKW